MIKDQKIYPKDYTQNLLKNTHITPFIFYDIFTLSDTFFTPILLFFVIGCISWRLINGWIISFIGNCLFRSHGSADETFREGVGGISMGIFYWIGGIVALGLLVYLAVALMKPEIFS